MKLISDFVIIILYVVVISCSNELEIENLQHNYQSFVPLSIQVNDTRLTKSSSQLIGDQLPEGSELGIFVTTASGESYDNKGYNNVKYTSIGSGTNQIWETDNNIPILLSNTYGNIYAYYPRLNSNVTLNEITISNDGTDWMYTPSAVTGINMSNPNAVVTLKHATSKIRVKILGANEFANGDISNLILKGDGWATSAKLNLQTGNFSSYEGVGAELIIDELGYLTLSGYSHDFWVISTNQPTTITFQINVDKDLFQVSTPEEIIIERGKVYSYTLSIDSHKRVVLYSVDISDWKVTNNSEVDSEMFYPWSTISLDDGVYAMTNLGEPVVYEEAISIPIKNYSGVAIVCKGKAYEIAKVDASSSSQWDINETLSDNAQTIFNPYYIINSDGNNEKGYLLKPDNTYQNTPYLSPDITTWITGALSDFEGKANTKRINQAGITIASVIISFNLGEYNQGNSDWYLPAEGQLAYIYMNHDKINRLLEIVGGSTMVTTDYYWASSIYSSGFNWSVDFSTGFVGHGGGIYYKRHVRLIRDL